jgi:hypothetical protein
MTAHPYELAEMQKEDAEEACPPTSKSPPSPKVKERKVEIPIINANGSPAAESKAIVPGHKDYANFQEFWDDPCWGGPIDWKAR